MLDGGAAGGIAGAATGFALGVRTFGEPILGAVAVGALGMAAGCVAGAAVGGLIGVAGSIQSPADRDRHRRPHRSGSRG